jgi:hypothetical protein
LLLGNKTREFERTIVYLLDSYRATSPGRTTPKQMALVEDRKSHWRSLDNMQLAKVKGSKISHLIFLFSTVDPETYVD